MDITSESPKKSRPKPLMIVLLLALVVVIVVLDMRRRDAENKLAQLSVQVGQTGGNEAQNQEVAKQVIEKVRRLYTIPAGIEPTVATIVDVKQLRERNAFYAKAKNGDHLIVTNDRAILYDPIADKIVDVVPVQITPPSSASSSSSSKK